MHGSVLLYDKDIWTLRTDEVSRRLAIMPQAEHREWPLTVEDAVRLGRVPHRGWLLPYRPQDRQIVEQALLNMGLCALRNRPITELSGGEWRRVVLARALAQEAKVLLLDEPTAGLDLKFQAEVLRLVRRLATEQQLVVVLTLHDLNQASFYGHRLALLSEQSLKALGSPQEVLTEELISQTFGVPVAVTRHPVYGTPLVAPLADLHESDECSAMAPLPPELSILWLAFLLDLVVREPPNVVHPVAWMGKAIGLLRKRAPKHGCWKPLRAGTAIVLGGCAATMTGLLLASGFRAMPFPLSIFAEALVLKLMFSARALMSAGEAVQRALEADDLTAARHLVGWHLVSRDTSNLNNSQVAAAAIESVAENANDSIVAPLLFYTIAGLPGVLGYRFINTCDAMLGYRDAERKWLGNCSARVDDLANFIPARLTAALMILASVPVGGSVCRGSGPITATRASPPAPTRGIQ